MHAAANTVLRGPEVNVLTSLHVGFGAHTPQELIAACMLSETITLLEV